MADAKVKLTDDGFILSCVCGAKHEVTLKEDENGKTVVENIDSSFAKPKENDQPKVKPKSIWNRDKK